jgi:hypothetical protein
MAVADSLPKLARFRAAGATCVEKRCGEGGIRTLGDKLGRQYLLTKWLKSPG